MPTLITLSSIRIELGGVGTFSFSTMRSLSPNASTQATSMSQFTSGDLFKGILERNPATHAADIKTLTGTNRDGIYYILCNGKSTKTYCLMDSKYNGGGWMLIMKCAKGTTFHYDATYWTQTNTLNTTSLHRTMEDAKFDAFNYVLVKDVMAIWPAADFGYTGGSLTISDGWFWVVNNWWNNTTTRVTPLSGFQTARNANPSNVWDFAGMKTGVFSYQSVENRHVFGGHSHIGNNKWGTARWGFVWNENAVGDFNSCDAWSGIGVSKAADNTFSITEGKSAGDTYGCCGTTGYNRTMEVELYAR